MMLLRADFAETFPFCEDKFQSIMAIDGQLHRNVTGRKTVRFNHLGKSYFLKTHTGVGWKEILKNLVQFRLPVLSARTEWRALHRLQAVGIDTLTPVGYGYEGKSPARLRSFLITEDLGDTETLEELCFTWKAPGALSKEQIVLKRALLAKVAGIVRRMHDHGINHRDLYLCHLRIHRQADKANRPEDTPIYLLDLHRAQLRVHTPARWTVKDLAALYFSSMDLGLTSRDLYRFIKTYTRRPLRNSLRDEGAFWKKVETRATTLYEKMQKMLDKRQRSHSAHLFSTTVDALPGQETKGKPYPLSGSSGLLKANDRACTRSKKNGPMKIFIDGIVFSYQHEGGVSRMFREVLPRIAEMDDGVSFLLYLRRRLMAAKLPASNSISYLHERSPYPRKWFSHGAQVQGTLFQHQGRLLQSVYLQAKPDIFHSTYFTIPSSLRTPYVVTVHDMIYELFQETFHKPNDLELVQQIKYCIERADLIFSVSESTTRDIHKFIKVDGRKIITVHNGVSPQFRCINDEIRKADFLKRNALSRPFFLYVGRRRFYKNFLRVLNAYAEFRLRHDVDLVAVGGEDRFTEEEKALIAGKRLSSRVKHLEELSEEDLVLLYNTAQAFLYPSLYEGFGLPPLEAMACGTPVIAAHSSSIPEICGDAALYFDPRDDEEIRAAMEAVLQKDTATA